MSHKGRKFIVQLVAVVGVLSVSSCVAVSSGTGAIYTAYYVPDAVEYAGSIFVYLKNTTNAPLAITDIALDGKSIGKVWKTDESFLQPDVRDQYIPVENDLVAWYRVYPNPVPAGGIAEVILRLDSTACEAAQHEVSLTAAGQEPLTAVVSMSEPSFTLEYVGIGENLDELHIYTRSQAGADMDILRVELDGRSAEADIHTVFSGYTYAQVKLQDSWQKGSFHAVAIGTADDLRAVLIRALPSPAPLGIMGNNHESELQQYANHLFDATIAFTAVPATSYPMLSKYGLGGAYIYGRSLKPGEKKREPVYYDNVEQVAPIKEQEALWAYFLEDEPDGRYHNTDLPRLSISRDVERANQFCRIFDLAHPTYLQIDHGGYPRNLYVYGQIPDYICAHAYALGRGIIEPTQDHVLNTQAASRPRPFYYLNDGYCANKEREFDPDEMRIEVYTALASGAKSLQWYPAHGTNGLLKHPKMWNAVGEVNGILQQVLPLTSIGIPVGEPLVDGGNYLSSCILCGDKAMVVILVNKDFQSTPEQFIRAETPAAAVRVRLPSFMKAAGVVRMRFPGGLPDIPADIKDSTVKFNAAANPVEMLLIYSRESVFEGLRQRHAECLQRFVPMPEPEPAG